MKENQKSMRRAFELQPPGAVRSSIRQAMEDPLKEQKQEMRDLIEKEKQEEQKKLLDKRNQYRESLKRQREELEEVNQKLSNPLGLEQLRQTLRQLRRNLGSIQLFAEEDDIDPDDMTYEVWLAVIQQLLELGEKIGNVSKGLTEQQMKKLSSRQYIREQHGEQKCTVCYCELEDGCSATELKCGHLFHSECIGQWLRSEKVCPLCKVETV